MDKNRKKQVKRYIVWGVAVVLVVLLAVMPLLAAKGAEADGPQASILTAQAQRRDITKKIIGGGTLSSAEKKNLTIPEEVKLVEYLVGNGDVVSEGDVIAVVDKVSVMTAITKVQESLDYLADEIQSTREQVVEESVTSQVAGTVKKIYAQVGDDVQDVMLEHGALAVLSLDDLMAVRIDRPTGLAAGETVMVELEDGTEVEGVVDSNLDGVLVVTVEDDDYAPGQQVSVYTEDGSRIGIGYLYIYSPWTAHGYTGIVADVRVKEGQSVIVGQGLLRLEETGQTAEHQAMIKQYHEFEDMMKDLFRMYSTGTVTAPCDGIVSGVDKEGAFMLSSEGGWTLSLLTHETNQDAGFWGYCAQVQSVRPDGLELFADPEAKRIPDLTDLQADTSAMTKAWSYTGSTRVYTCADNGILTEAGYARQGDVLLFVGDENTIHWIIRMDGTGVKNTETQSGYQGAVLAKLTSLLEGEIPSGGEGTGGTSTGGTETSGTETGGTGTGEVYNGYVAQVSEIDANGGIKVYQTVQPYILTDLNNLPEPKDADLSMEVTYYGLNVKKGDILWIIMKTDGTIYRVQLISSAPEEPAGPGTGGSGGGIPGGMGGFGDLSGFGGMGGFSGMGGTVEEEESPTYTQETVTIATVTSQETITLDVTVDEADILLLSVGQEAELTVTPLAGETFAATIIEIANDGVNDGGRTKFTVTVSTQKHSDMYPGMTGTLAVTTDIQKDVLVLPVAALVEEGTKTFVYTGYDGEKKTLINPVEITTGLSDGEYVEVFGIDEGTEVHYAYYDTLVLSNVPQGGGMFG